MGYNPGFLTTWLFLNPFCILTIFYAWKFNILTHGMDSGLYRGWGLYFDTYVEYD
ncbi:MAG: hypothetical protein Q7I96_02775 [Methanobacteriaceae archaeon]|nr:hypothetical protein [Methanobacteriaceae archaeon]